ncbi:hypothetical protein [Leifsonia poae]|uniref:Uncharacterized protein n=1 Tax=Leifsonia poae TaxID=110933 RepID=A0A9W6LZF5_9MICO|nr:hypothetical protein [Leifsonia poae]GLJ75885.1 hypothetical protein GCM10017584_14590 [Leifsonia poae]
MTTFDHHLPITGSVAQVTRGRGALATIADNAYLKLFAVLVVIAAGAVALVFGIAFVLDLVVPVLFGNELHALAALFPQTAG